jgi:hypothetical protein
MAQKLKSITIGGQKFEVEQGGITEGGYKGLKENLPVLSLGKFGFCTDTNELFVGSSEGNICLSVGEKEEEIEFSIKGLESNSFAGAPVYNKTDVEEQWINDFFGWLD